MKLFTGKDGTPLFSSKRVLLNFLVLVLCSQFAFSVLAMKGALLPQMLELWQISKTQFGLLMSIYGIVHNIFIWLWLGQGPFLATHSDSGEYGVGRHHDVFSRPNQRLCHAVLSIRHAVTLVRRRILARHFVQRT